MLAKCIVTMMVFALRIRVLCYPNRNEIEETEEAAEEGKLRCYECDQEQCNAKFEDMSITRGAVRCWTANVTDEDGQVRILRSGTDAGSLDHCGKRKNRSMFIKLQRSNMTIHCCESDLCNVQTLPEIKYAIPSQGEYSYFPYVVVGAISGLIATVIGAIIYKLVRRERFSELKLPYDASDCDSTNYADLISRNDTDRTTDSIDSSGSGHGETRLKQSGCYNFINLEAVIGNGKYGEVWKGSYKNRAVAVKICLSKDEESFQRETQIYKTALLKHDNILEYITDEVATSGNGIPQLWLIYPYYSRGSLYDFLANYVMNKLEMLTALSGVAKGLSHLHMEIHSLEKKPIIAHRDVKSKNILVKPNCECVIADFGLSCTSLDIEKDAQKPDNSKSSVQVGTKRYMSPEILDKSIWQFDINSYTRADVYAFALVIWEVLRRTKSVEGEEVEDAQPPYYDVVDANPSFEDMKKVVCDLEKRPEVEKRWLDDDLLKLVTNLMEECWRTNPNARLSSLRISKNFDSYFTLLEETETRE